MLEDEPYWNSFGLSYATDGSTGSVIKDNIWDSAAFGSPKSMCMEIAGDATLVGNNTCRGGNWQSGHVVLGFETDFDWAHINGDPVLPGICAATICFTHNVTSASEASSEATAKAPTKS